MDRKEIVAENLKKYLKLRGHSQVELANHLGLSRAAVCNWISLATSPDINCIVEICKFLEISVNDLFGFHDDKHLSVKEKIVLMNYRSSEFQDAVDFLLKIEK